VAGSGKTTTLRELCKGIKSGGKSQVFLVAPTNSAVAVLREEGFDHSTTVSMFLTRPEIPVGATLIIDESGLNSLRQGAEVMRLARERDCRVIFVGDSRQHSGVEAGDFFRILENFSKIKTVSLSEIYRQCEEVYRRGIVLASRGELAQSIQTFWDKGWIIEGKGKYLERAARDFMKFSKGGRRPEDCLLVAMTHRECDLLTGTVRARLKGKHILDSEGERRAAFRSFNWTLAQTRDIRNYRPGMAICVASKWAVLGGAGRTFKIEKVLEDSLQLDSGAVVAVDNVLLSHVSVGETREIELCRGDKIQFAINDKERGIINGQIGLVLKDGMVELESGAVVELGGDFCGFDYGWVKTSHKSQGRTSKNVVVAAERMDAKGFYVSLSRGRENMRLHCPDSRSLQYHILKNAGNRKSAMEILRENPHVLNNPNPHEEIPEMTYPTEVRKWIDL